MSQYKYIANGWHKFAELDIYADGCQPDRPSHDSGADYFEAETVDGLIAKLAEHVNQKDLSNVILDSCDERGRVDIQVYEDSDGYAADAHDLAQWKEGKKELWLACYTFHVERIETSDDFTLADSVADKTIYSS